MKMKSSAILLLLIATAPTLAKAGSFDFKAWTKHATTTGDEADCKRTEDEFERRVGQFVGNDFQVSSKFTAFMSEQILPVYMNQNNRDYDKATYGDKVSCNLFLTLNKPDYILVNHSHQTSTPIADENDVS